MSSFCCRHLHCFLQILLFFCLAGIRDRSVYAQALSAHQPARIFHTDSSRGAANPYVDKEGDGLRRRLYASYCPRSNSKLTQYPSGVRKPQQNQCEISGLEPRVDSEESIRNFKPWLEASNASGNFFF